MQLFEITLEGFDGGTDATDDHVIWVAAENDNDVLQAMPAGATFCGAMGPYFCKYDDGAAQVKGWFYSGDDAAYTLPADADTLRQLAGVLSMSTLHQDAMAFTHLVERFIRSDLPVGVKPTTESEVAEALYALRAKLSHHAATRVRFCVTEGQRQVLEGRSDRHVTLEYAAQCAENHDLGTPDGHEIAKFFREQNAKELAAGETF